MMSASLWARGPIITCTWPSLSNVPASQPGVTQQGRDSVPPERRGLVFSGQMFLLHPLAHRGVWSHTFQPFQTQFKLGWHFRDRTIARWVHFPKKTRMIMYLCFCGFPLLPYILLWKYSRIYYEKLKSLRHQSPRCYHRHLTIICLYCHLFIHWSTHWSFHQSSYLFKIKLKVHCSRHQNAFHLILQHCYYLVTKTNDKWLSQVYPIQLMTAVLLSLSVFICLFFGPKAAMR